MQNTSITQPTIGTAFNVNIVYSKRPHLIRCLGRINVIKKHEIRGWYERNSHVLEIVKKGVFSTEKSVIWEEKGVTIST